MIELSVKKLARELDLELLCGEEKKTVEISCVDVNRPGLFLAGFHQHFDKTACRSSARRNTRF